MTLDHMRLLRAGLLALVVLACRDKGQGAGDSTRGSLPPISATAPGNSTNWDVDAGPVILVSMGNSADSAAVILPDISDSTIASVQGTGAPVSGLAFDLFGRTGKLGASKAVVAIRPDSTHDCYAWPLAGVRAASPGWRIGFTSGHAQAIKLDSIEAMSSTDSASLAASLARTAATLPIASDPTFRGLPFRVRSAYTFRFDSVDVVVADVVRSVNEEANPRLEHLFIIGERPAGIAGKYTPAYYSRTAGAEETTPATEVLAAVLIGSSRRPAVVVNIENDDGRQLGLIEHTAPGQWRSVWRSAYTDC
jgi:hypothetical protein